LTPAAGAVEQWRNYQTEMLTPDRQRQRLAGLDEASEGFKLLPALDARCADLRVRKVKYSAFIQGSSDIDAALISDCNATLTDEEHAAALNTFMMFFGDVMTGDEAIAPREIISVRSAIWCMEVIFAAFALRSPPLLPHAGNKFMTGTRMLRDPLQLVFAVRARPCFFRELSVLEDLKSHAPAPRRIDLPVCKKS
jgi:hypothetical protein